MSDELLKAAEYVRDHPGTEDLWTVIGTSKAKRADPKFVEAAKKLAAFVLDLPPVTVIPTDRGNRIECRVKYVPGEEIG
jgi:hypothetical protein